jgi:hypothetical protein
MERVTVGPVSTPSLPLYPEEISTADLDMTAKAFFTGVIRGVG